MSIETIDILEFVADAMRQYRQSYTKPLMDVAVKVTENDDVLEVNLVSDGQEFEFELRLHGLRYIRDVGEPRIFYDGDNKTNST